MALRKAKNFSMIKLNLKPKRQGVGRSNKAVFSRHKLSFPSNTNFIEINSQTTLEDLEKHEFDKNNVVIGVIGNEKKGIEIVNQAFKVAPVVIVAAPISWRSQYSTQSKIDNTAKLVMNEPMGVFSVDGKTAKLTAQIWVKIFSLISKRFWEKII